MITSPVPVLKQGMEGWVKTADVCEEGSDAEPLVVLPSQYYESYR